MSETSITKYDYIDALRGLAILSVVMVHSSQNFPPRSELLIQIAGQGARGVQLFFIASALTLFLSMDARGRESQPLANFFIRRYFRIAPAFYLALIFYTFYKGMAPSDAAPNGIKEWFILSTALFLHGWHPETINSVVPGGWSIAVEMTFYLLVPYLFRKINNISSALALLFGALILASISSTLIADFFRPYYPDTQQYLISTFTFYWFFEQLPVFALGILLYHIIKMYPTKNKIAGFFLLLVSILFFWVFLNPNTFNNLLPVHFLYGLSFVILSLSLHFWPQKFLVNKVTTFIGRLSFSIYLVHFLVRDKVAFTLVEKGISLPGNKGAVLAFLIILAISTGISYVTYHLIEIPGINLGRRVIGWYGQRRNDAGRLKDLADL